ncbi:sensor histidine kinase [Pseudobutyrivibrio xylanivorans]|uniref:GHKL domain-containing protein n=1 Tax=Pseudobutyrivibrio xylanivorans TaxID=185007 RepID=A0A5P6VR89_PSEXY|nr:sensor histidine kinase [Pseudobutyrivibrio xylanivorans]QFJ55183.1 GHKL domain-containing protein [Pseudobutyrivibrio xylanivorans]
MIYQLYRTTELEGVIHFALLLYILHQVFPKYRKGFNNISFFGLSMGTFLIFKYAPYFIPQIHYNRPYWYFYFIALPISLFFAHLCLDGIFFLKTIYISFFIAFIELSKMICSPLYSMENTMNPTTYAMIDIISGLLLFIFLVLLGKLFKYSAIHVDASFIKPRFFFVLYLPISLLVFYWSGLFDIPWFKRYQDAILALIILPIIPMFYDFFSTFLKASEEQRRLDLALTDTRAQVFRYRYSLELEERIKKERHELKNNYLYIQTLLNEGKVDKLQDYLDNTIGEKLSQLSAISTGNTMIDYILNRKIAEAQRHGIKVYSEILLPAELPINDDEFCTIFLNLFNNAFEACSQVDNPDIHITIKCIKSYLTLEVSNKINSELLSNNPELKTTKTDKENHGLGLKIIKDVVSRNDGIFQTTIEGNYFHGKVMLALEK